MQRMPNRLNAAEIRALREPLTTAMIALRLGTATEQHLNDLCAAVHIAYSIASAVQRHHYLLPTITAASDALIAQGAGFPYDVDAIDSGVEIYSAIIIATPRPKVAQIMTRAFRTAQAAAC